MYYETSYLIAGLILLLILLYHYMCRNRLRDANSRIFHLFLFVGIMDISMDLVTTYLITAEKPQLRLLTIVMMTLFYLLQALICYMLFLYAWSLSNRHTPWEMRFRLLMAIPAIAMGVFVLFNLKTGMLFSVDGTGQFIRGEEHQMIYITSVFYGLMIFLTSVLRMRRIGRKNFQVICEFMVILVVSVAIQVYDERMLVTGFGLSLGLLIFCLTVNNPSDYADRLTDALNTESCRAWLKEEYELSRKFQLIAVDLIGLGKVNMLYGKAFGDRFLRRMVAEMKSILGSEHVFRISGKKFVLMTYSIYDYNRVWNGLQELFAMPLLMENEEIHLNGIVCGFPDGNQLENKENLRDYVEYMLATAPTSTDPIFLQSNHESLQSFQYHQEVERFLHIAIDEDLFEVYVQPIYSRREDTFVAVECLSRLNHPTLGYIPPDVFIRVAEVAGLVSKIGYLQLRKICHFFSDHPALCQRLDSVKINLSPMELLREDFMEKLMFTIESYGLPLDFFQLEITETMATEYNMGLRNITEDMIHRGLSFNLDDFGSGYANLDMVLNLPFSAIKIDRSLLQGVLVDKKSAIFYQSIVSTLQNLGYDVIAEGIETKEEADLLTHWGVDLLQGYYYARPMPIADFLDMMIPKAS